MTITEAAARYRVVSEPTWRVECFHDGEWKVSGYCSSEESANKAMERRIQACLRFAQMTPEERAASILRNDANDESIY